MLLAAAGCCASETCPWLNAATASGVLGGDVTVRVTETSCVFKTQDKKTLSIEVKAGASYLSKCGTHSTPVKAIGNEAVVCSGGDWAMVAGRVRDRGFLVRVNASETEVSLREKAQKVAEQVAGILF